MRIEYQIKCFKAGFPLGGYCLKHGLWEKSFKKSYFKEIFEGDDWQYPITCILAFHKGTPIALSLFIQKTGKIDESNLQKTIIGHAGFYVVPQHREKKIASHMAKALFNIITVSNTPNDLKKQALVLKEKAFPLKKFFPQITAVSLAKFDDQTKEWVIPPEEIQRLVKVENNTFSSILNFVKIHLISLQVKENKKSKVKPF